MNSDASPDGSTDPWPPPSRDASPDVTLRGGRNAFLAFEINPDRLPTETIGRHGRSLRIGSLGNLEENAPDPVPRYEWIEQIGTGGMGIVGRAEDRALQREVAIKLCKLDGTPGTSQTLAAAGEFTHEAFMTAHLDHPGVVPIYALARDPDGRPFFAMKKVEGIPWSHLLHPDSAPEASRAAAEERARRMDWKDHLAILLKVCDTVAYAHSKAILHRDLKPENIMIGEFGEAYVMDWGLALYFDDRNEYRRHPDLTPQLAGTPAYIAPEMVRGRLADLGPAADIYLLGGILHELLTGRPPRQGRDVMDVLRQAARGDVPPLIPQDLLPGWPPTLLPVAAKALCPDPAGRYAAVRDFQRDLSDCLTHAESIAVTRRARQALERLQTEGILADDIPSPSGLVPDLSRDDASLAYGRLSECIGGFRQALALWPDNHDARQGLADALCWHVRLAIRQDDLTLARAQLRLLREPGLPPTDPGPDPLAARIEERQTRLRRSARRIRLWRAAAATFGLLFLGGLAAIAFLGFRQRTLAIRNEQDMFVASVAGCARTVGQFMLGIEQLTRLYQQTAVELLTLPADQLPRREPTPAGRDGFYYDEDFADPAARPPGMVPSPRYQTRISPDYPTVVRAPWARGPDTRPAVENAAVRLGRLNRLFSRVHRVRPDILWSLAGSETGLLLGFPGFARYGDKPDYDPTRRAWYLAAIHAPDNRPVWGNPYADANTRVLLCSCMGRLHVDGRSVGVVGVEITLDTLQGLLRDFSGDSTARRRGLLLRAMPEPDPDGGPPRTVHRIVVDTDHPRTAEDWQTRLELKPVEEAGDLLHACSREIASRRLSPGDCLEISGAWVTCQPILDGQWIVLALLDRANRR